MTVSSPSTPRISRWSLFLSLCYSSLSCFHFKLYLWLANESHLFLVELSSASHSASLACQSSHNHRSLIAAWEGWTHQGPWMRDPPSLGYGCYRPKDRESLLLLSRSWDFSLLAEKRKWERESTWLVHVKEIAIRGGLWAASQPLCPGMHLVQWEGVLMRLRNKFSSVWSLDLKHSSQGFPGCPVAKTLRSQCSGPGFDSLSGN